MSQSLIVTHSAENGLFVIKGYTRPHVDTLKAAGAVYDPKRICWTLAAPTLPQCIQDIVNGQHSLDTPPRALAVKSPALTLPDTEPDGTSPDMIENQRGLRSSEDWLHPRIKIGVWVHYRANPQHIYRVDDIEQREVRCFRPSDGHVTRFSLRQSWQYEVVEIPARYCEADGTSEYMVENHRGLKPGEDWLEFTHRWKFTNEGTVPGGDLHGRITGLWVYKGQEIAFVADLSNHYYDQGDDSTHWQVYRWQARNLPFDREVWNECFGSEFKRQLVAKVEELTENEPVTLVRGALKRTDDTTFLTEIDPLAYLKVLYLRGKLSLKLWDVYVPSWSVERGFMMLYEDEWERELLTSHVRALGGFVEDGNVPQICYARGERLWEQIPIREWDAKRQARAAEERRQGIERLRVKAPGAFDEQGNFSVGNYMLNYTGLGRQWKGEANV